MAWESVIHFLQFYVFFWILLLCMLSIGSGESNHANWDVRLAGSRVTTEGRVEVYLHGQWGTILDLHTWGENETRAVCKQLGFNYENVAVLERGYYGQGTGPVHLTNVRCQAGEISLEDCTYKQETSYESVHIFDVAVTCKAEIRLHGNKNSGTTMDGVIQLFSDNNWPTLCTSKWTEADSQVACRQLGYTIGRAVKLRIQDTDTSYYPWDYHCTGNERTLERCPGHRSHIIDCQWHAHFLTCNNATPTSAPQDNTTFWLSTISGSLIFLVIIIAVLLAYLISIKKRARRHRRWITSANGRQQCQPNERQRWRTRRTRRVRDRNQRRSAPNVYSISNGQRGNDRDLPPYSRLEEDTPPPYSQLPLPRIEIPVVGREERYEEQPPRFTETDAIEFFQELDAERLRLQYENAAVERSQRQPPLYPEQPPPAYVATANQPQQEIAPPVNHQPEMDNTSQAGSISSDDEGDDISLSSCRSPIPIIPKDTVNINTTITSVEV